MNFMKKKYSDIDIENMFNLYFVNKDKHLEHKLVEANMPLVVHIVSKIISSGYSSKRSLQMNDMIQEGNIGLILAIRKFDPTRGMTISTYASWWIKSYLYRYILANWNLIKIGTNMKERDAFFKLGKYLDLLKEDKTNSGEVLSKYSQELGITPEYLTVLNHRVKYGECSFDDNATISNNYQLSSSLNSNEEVIDNDDYINDVLSRCFSLVKNKKHLEIFKKRHLENMSFVDIGNIYGVSRQRVDQIEKKVLSYIKTKVQDGTLTL